MSVAHVYEPENTLIALCGHTREVGEPERPTEDIGACGYCMAVFMVEYAVEVAEEIGTRTK